MISSTKNSLEFHLWIDFGLGAKEGFKGVLHLKLKLEEKVLASYSTNKASILNSHD